MQYTCSIHCMLYATQYTLYVYFCCVLSHFIGAASAVDAVKCKFVAYTAVSCSLAPHNYNSLCMLYHFRLRDFVYYLVLSYLSTNYRS